MKITQPKKSPFRTRSHINPNILFDNNSYHKYHTEYCSEGFKVIIKHHNIKILMSLYQIFTKSPFSDTPVSLQDPGDRVDIQINTRQGFYALQQVPNPDVLCGQLWRALAM